MPSNPNKQYQEWRGWGEFLNVYNPGGKRKENVLSYKAAQVVCSDTNVVSSADYFRRYKKISESLPSNPNVFYKEWSGWLNYLGTTDLSKSPVILPVSYLEAQNICLENNVFSSRDYYKRYKTVSNTIPRNPNRVYKNKGWIDWKTFLQPQASN
jgi:hypothetical protein